MRLDKNTYGTVLAVYLLSAVAVFALWRWVPVWWVNTLASIFLLWFCSWQTYFHMVPDRTPVGSDRLVSAAMAAPVRPGTL